MASEQALAVSSQELARTRRGQKFIGTHEPGPSSTTGVILWDDTSKQQTQPSPASNNSAGTNVTNTISADAY